MRAQIAMEYVLVMMVASALLIGYLLTVLAVQERSGESLRGLESDRIAAQLQEEILIATQVRDGYRRSFHIPVDIAGEPYSITTEEGVIAVEGDRSFAQRLVPDFNGTPTPGTNTIIRSEGEVRFI